MNNVVHRYHWVIIGCLNFVILLGCSLAYRSFVAGLMLLIPVNLANFTLTAAMHLIGIGLDVNSLMVAEIGIGVGIDYAHHLRPEDRRSGKEGVRNRRNRWRLSH